MQLKAHRLGLSGRKKERKPKPPRRLRAPSRTPRKQGWASHRRGVLRQMRRVFHSDVEPCFPERRAFDELVGVTRSVRIDGEAVVLCPKPGLWLFDQLHSCRRDRDVNLYVFDLLEFNGRVSDRFRLRSARRGSRVSSRLRQGIKLSEHIDAVFRHACKPRAHRLQSARLFEI